MSTDQPPGPGWWKASDGNWYPPQEPAPAPTPAAPPAADQPPGPGWWKASDGNWYPPQGPGAPGAPGQVPPPVPATGAGGGGGSSSSKGLVIGAIAVLVLVLGGLGFLLLSGDDDDGGGEIDASVFDTDGPPPTGSGEGDGGLGDPDMDGTTPPATNPPATTAPPPDTAPPPTIPPADAVVIVGDEGEEVNALARAAIVDLNAMWSEALPEVFGIEYVEPQGGYWATSPDEEAPPCAQSADDVFFNAYYCPLADNIAWDDTFLFPEFRERSGPLVIGLIMAHEWGHAIQERIGVLNVNLTVTTEVQADCFAGAWVQRVFEGESLTWTTTFAELELSIASFLELADQPGTAATDPNAHGNGFDRINAFQEGLDGGVGSCAGYTDDTVLVTALPFNDEVDAAQGGNMPLADALELMPQDIEAYWRQVFQEAFGSEFVAPTGGFVTFDGTTELLSCGGETVDLQIFYCPADDYIALDAGREIPQLYSDFGDFAVAAFVARTYGLLVQQRLGVSEDVLLNNLQADCLAGMWAGSIFPLVVENRTESLIIMSPGDLDEAIASFLALTSDPERQGTGFDRVTAFRAGVVDGLDGCVAYDP